MKELCMGVIAFIIIALVMVGCSARSVTNTGNIPSHPASSTTITTAPSTISPASLPTSNPTPTPTPLPSLAPMPPRTIAPTETPTMSPSPAPSPTRTLTPAQTKTTTPNPTPSSTSTAVNITARNGARISIVNPATVAVGSHFNVYVNVGPVTDLTSWVFDLTYDSSIIQVLGLQNQDAGVSGGLLGTINTPIDGWNTYPGGNPGSPVSGNTIRVMTILIPVNSITHDGTAPSYIAVVHFKVLDGVVNDSISPLKLTNVGLGDSMAHPIVPITVVNGSVTVATPPS